MERSTHPKKFFTPPERTSIAAAIYEMESRTSGEIRLHVEERVKGDVMKRARFVFSRLGMHRTKLRNAVLIYLAIKNFFF